jgi:hypothetical protein
LPRPHRSSVRRHIRTIRRSLTSIILALERLAPALEPGSGAAPGRRKLRLSPRRRAALALQGAYIGHLRNLAPRQKSRVKALRAAGGVRAAIKLAKKLARP